eukprot:6534450-Prymnesium_polylepis.1
MHPIPGAQRCGMTLRVPRAGCLSIDNLKSHISHATWHASDLIRCLKRVHTASIKMSLDAQSVTKRR